MPNCKLTFALPCTGFITVTEDRCQSIPVRVIPVTCPRNLFFGIFHWILKVRAFIVIRKTRVNSLSAFISSGTDQHVNYFLPNWIYPEDVWCREIWVGEIRDGFLLLMTSLDNAAIALVWWGCAKGRLGRHCKEHAVVQRGLEHLSPWSVWLGQITHNVSRKHFFKEASCQ